MRVLITGAAGYVGSVLIDALQAMDNVTGIIGVDLKARPARLAGNAKIEWIQADVSSDDWQAPAREHGADAVVHLAFQIRQLYGRKQQTQRQWNVDGACKVFAFVFAEPSVRRLIHFSTVTAYGARMPAMRLRRAFAKAPRCASATISMAATNGKSRGRSSRRMQPRTRAPMSWCCAARRSAAPMAASSSVASASCRP